MSDSDQHDLTTRFLQRVNLSLTLRVKVALIAPGDCATLWQVAHHAGYVMPYADFLAVCRTVNLLTLCAELVHVIRPLQEKS